MAILLVVQILAPLLPLPLVVVAVVILLQYNHYNYYCYIIIIIRSTATTTSNSVVTLKFHNSQEELLKKYQIAKVYGNCKLMQLILIQL